MKSDDQLRPIQVICAPSIGTKQGYFHKWCDEPFMHNPENMTKTYALVELIDGSVKLIEPQYLKFTEPYQSRK